MTSDAPRLPAPPIVGDVALNRGPVPASPPIDETTERRRAPKT